MLDITTTVFCNINQVIYNEIYYINKIFEVAQLVQFQSALASRCHASMVVYQLLYPSVDVFLHTLPLAR